ncbi:MAG TPA: hypothetical protein VN238_17665 [Solirubrobacteraceae bacterium]|nr:hypothetical protein [Solirubrobacteraceae bacterium]
MPRTVPLLLALLLCALAAAPAPGAEVGISDQNAATWSDARVRALGLENARLVVPWNAATTEPDRVQAWLDATAAAGLEPHIAFEHARGTQCPSRPCTYPTRAAYAAAVRAFLARFPRVRTYTTWNEANHVTQPVSDRPETVAGYYEDLRAACPSCTVVAGDVLDSGSYVRWLERFQAATDSDPQLWGLHNYGDVTYGRTTGTDRVLAAVPGRLWLEETGGIVTLRGAGGRVTLPSDEERAARGVTQAFAMARVRPRIERLYVYQWKALALDRFDAGLVRPDDSTRPSYAAMLAGMRSGAAQPAPRWRTWWAGQHLKVKLTCRASDKRCRGTARIVLRTRAKGTKRWTARLLATRTYRTVASKGTVTLRIKVPATLRKRARQAQYRRVALTVRATTPAAEASKVALTLRR